MQYQPQLRPEHITAMKRKQEQAYRAGTALADWLAYEKEIEAEASAAAKLNADLTDANAPV